MGQMGHQAHQWFDLSQAHKPFGTIWDSKNQYQQAVPDVPIVPVFIYSNTTKACCEI